MFNVGSSSTSNRCSFRRNWRFGFVTVTTDWLLSLLLSLYCRSYQSESNSSWSVPFESIELIFFGWTSVSPCSTFSGEHGLIGEVRFLLWLITLPFVCWESGKPVQHGNPLPTSSHSSLHPPRISPSNPPPHSTRSTLPSLTTTPNRSSCYRTNKLAS